RLAVRRESVRAGCVTVKVFPGEVLFAVRTPLAAEYRVQMPHVFVLRVTRVEPRPLLRRNPLFFPCRFSLALCVTRVTPGMSTVPRAFVRRKLRQWLGLVAEGTHLEPVRDAVAPSGPRFHFLVKSWPVLRRNTLSLPTAFPVAP